MLKPLNKPKTLKENALEEIRKAIMFGHFKPGEKLIERVLCEQLEVSRTVIRECLGHLESEGLVKIIHNSGPIVAKLSLKEIKEIYDLRALLESKAVKDATLTASDIEISYLFKIVSEIESALTGRNIIDAIEMTNAFYQLIFKISELNISWRVVNQLNSRITQYRVLSLSSPGRNIKGPKQLKMIVDAMAKKDATTAEKACRQHVNDALNVVINLIDL